MATDDLSACLFVGRQESDCLVVRPTRREFPDASDYSDGNWLCCDVRVRAGAFCGSYEALLRAEEFAGFRERLSALQAQLDGSAVFETMEQWLRISIRGDERGHFEASCETHDAPGGGNGLMFTLTFDQTDLPAMLRALDELVAAYPVKGRASS